MKVAVLGGGNGGLAIAFDWAQHGHEIALWAPPEHAGFVDEVASAGGISASGDMSGTVAIRSAGTDIAAALDGAELVFASGPAYATAPVAQAAREHLTPDQTVVVNPGSCAGAILFKHTLGLGPGDPARRVAETNTLPYAVRITGPAEITVYLRLRSGLFVSGLPREISGEVAAQLAEVWPGIEAAESVFQTTLENGNPVIHPAVTLLNAALIERTGGDFLFYEEGVTPGVGRLMRGVDEERMALARALGVKIYSEPELGNIQGYMEEVNYDTGYSTAPGFRGIKAQDRLDHRYLNEDVGYGLVFLSDVGRRIGVPTPTIDALIQIASVVMDRDYGSEAARTLAGLGLADADAAMLRSL